jgi:hypothetical protein
MVTDYFIESHYDRIDHLIENHFIKTKSHSIEGLFIESHFIEGLFIVRLVFMWNIEIKMVFDEKSFDEMAFDELVWSPRYCALP